MRLLDLRLRPFLPSFIVFCTDGLRCGGQLVLAAKESVRERRREDSLAVLRRGGIANTVVAALMGSCRCAGEKGGPLSLLGQSAYAERKQAAVKHYWRNGNCSIGQLNSSWSTVEGDSYLGELYSSVSFKSSGALRGKSEII